MINTNQLNKQQLQDLQHLANLCRAQNGSVPNLYTHILTQNRTFPASLLYYHNNELIGFLSVYFFYDDGVEISILVHPKHRRQGIAKKLMVSIIPLIQSQHYFKLIFSMPSNLNNTWLSTRGYTYLHSEYYMERNDLAPVLDCNRSLTFRLASSKDIPLLCSIDDLCFPKKHGDLLERFMILMGNRDYQIMVASHNNSAIGKAHIRWQDKGASLSDIAIHPQFQGKGFGSALIAHCINYALSEGKPLLNLDVETHNQKALNLYTQLGFAVQNACDYWSTDIETFRHLVQI